MRIQIIIDTDGESVEVEPAPGGSESLVERSNVDSTPRMLGFAPEPLEPDWEE